jgi:enterochelin esterase-like enzyme
MQTYSQIYYHPNPNPDLKAAHRNNRVKARCLVYTPPGFDDENGGSYPVVYLLHGVGDVEFSWELYGMASAILDELLKERLIPEMVVIMPFGFQNDHQKQQREFPTKDWFDGYLSQLITDDQMAVEKAYKIQVGSTADPRYVKRAIAGLSMGGKQALEFGLDHLELFSAIGNFSGAIQNRSGTDPLPALLQTCGTNVTQINDRLALFYHGCGREDETGVKKGRSLLAANKRLVDGLNQLNIRHIWREMEGKHQWGVWRACLREFLPLLATAWR